MLVGRGQWRCKMSHLVQDRPPPTLQTSMRPLCPKASGQAGRTSRSQHSSCPAYADFTSDNQTACVSLQKCLRWHAGEQGQNWETSLPAPLPSAGPGSVLHWLCLRVGNHPTRCDAVLLKSLSLLSDWASVPCYQFTAIFLNISGM